MAIVNMVFGSFDLHHEFFSPHQQSYLSHIVRVLVYTGQQFNFYDVMVMALDQEVIREQVEKASRQIERSPNLTLQRRLNFEMSVRSLYQSFQDRDRVQNIQGLLNKCMPFLDDELSVITGPYEDLLSIDDVIEQELILLVSLNINKNTEPVRALGKMLLQNLQLVVGKRYEDEEQRRRAHRPLFSVIMDEFAPFGYRNFAQILQTARGTNTAFLFSLQSLSQLMEVGKGFKEDVSSAPNTTMQSLTRDEETARHFLRASSEQRVTRRSRSMQRTRVFGYEKYEETGRAVESEERETRARDDHIKNLPTGQIEILMTDQTVEPCTDICTCARPSTSGFRTSSLSFTPSCGIPARVRSEPIFASRAPCRHRRRGRPSMLPEGIEHDTTEVTAADDERTSDSGQDRVRAERGVSGSHPSKSIQPAGGGTGARSRAART